MNVSPEKFKRMKALASRGAAAAGRGIKSTVLPIAGGAAAALAAEHVVSKLPFGLNEKWWGEAAALAVAGHFIGVKKSRRAGDALLGAAGYAGYKAYKAKDGAKGWDDAGALVDRMTSAVNQMNAIAAQAAPAMQAAAQLAQQARGMFADAGAIVGAGTNSLPDADYAQGIGVDDAGDWGDAF